MYIYSGRKMKVPELRPGLGFCGDGDGGILHLKEGKKLDSLPKLDGD